MANAAWAFVRPMEIVKGAEYYIDQRTEDLFNEQKLARGQADLDYLEQVRPMATQGASLDLALKQSAAEQASIQDAANRLITIPQPAGMTPAEKIQQQVALISAETNPLIQQKARQTLDLTVPQTAIGLANQGSAIEALNLIQSYTGQKLDTAQVQGLLANPASLQAFLSNRQLDMRIATNQAAAKLAVEKNKQAFELEKVRQQQLGPIEAAKIRGATDLQVAGVNSGSRERVAMTNAAGDLVVARERVKNSTETPMDLTKLYAEYLNQAERYGQPTKTRQQWEAWVRGTRRNSATGEADE